MKTTKMVVILVLALGLAAETANADFTFGTPTNLGPTVNSSANEAAGSMPADGLSLYFHSKRPGGYGDADLWVTTRPTTEDPWGQPVNLGPTFNGPHKDNCARISADGLELYFGSNRPGGYGDFDLYVSMRATPDDEWSPPVNLGEVVNTGASDRYPSITGDGLELYFNSLRPEGYGYLDVWVTTRATKDDPWGEPVHLESGINTWADDRFPSVSADGLVLFFYSFHRPGGSGDSDLCMTTRGTTQDDWTTPMTLGPNINTPDSDWGPAISADGRTLFFTSNRPGGIGDNDIWQVSIEPVVDFNGDGIVDSADMCIMVDHWGESYPLCDIGPMPWGDGIVDVQDLIVLAEHLFTYPGAVAYWKLDETEGNIAYDSAGVNDGILNGGPLWQPTGGQINGALAFDGIDDYVSTSLILDPADGAFSVVAWVKGGASGQVVISQAGGGNWLLTDPQAGALMTQLKGSGRTGGPLLSQTVVTDGHWHRIGLVWDGSYRILCVDGTEVAKDTEPQDYLEAAYGGLYFGAGATLEAANFFSGLIDDVRIYDRAISP